MKNAYIKKILVLTSCLFCFLIFSSLDQQSKKGKDLYGLYINKRLIPYLSYNKYDRNMVKLGKKLFYDNILSSTQFFSCADCHHPKYAFSDTVALSYSIITNHPLKYNTLSLVNLAFCKSYGYEGKYQTLEEYIKYHIGQNDIMNMENRFIVARLSKDTSYSNYFKKVLNTDVIDSTIVSNAIAQYLRTIVSINTNFEKNLWTKKLINEPDSVIFKSLFQKMSPNVKYALNLCFNCHSGLPFGGEITANIGLDKGSENDMTYRVANTKNLQLTGPYMHDGRFKTLEEVIEHYNSGIKYNKCLDPLLQKDGEPIRLNLNETEKKLIADYLRSLIDTTYNTVYDVK